MRKAGICLKRLRWDSRSTVVLLNQQGHIISLPVGKTSWEHSNFVSCVRFSLDGSKFITISSDKKGIPYDGKTGEKIGVLSSEDGQQGSIYAVSWSPDSKQVLTVSADKSAKVWEITEDGTGKVKKTLTCPGFGGADDMQVGCLWHYYGGVVKWVPGIGYCGKINMKNHAPVTCFAANDGELILSGFNNKVCRVPFDGNDCGSVEHVDVAGQPQDLSVAVNSPELILVAIDSEAVLLSGLKVLSSINLG